MLRAHRLHLAMFPLIAAAIALDRDGVATQALIALPLWALLIAWSQRLPEDERRTAWMVVGYSTFIELVATQLWHLYGYRLGNVPLYVPPGHGLIYVYAVTAARGPLFARFGVALRNLSLAVATAWALGGLALHRDVHGALYLPFFFAFLLRSPRANLFVATFALTSFIELLGVHLGTWHWAAVMPGLELPSGDPPSLIAGGYCCFGEVAIILSRAWSADRPGEAPAPSWR